MHRILISLCSSIKHIANKLRNSGKFVEQADPEDAARSYTILHDLHSVSSAFWESLEHRERCELVWVVKIATYIRIMLSFSRAGQVKSSVRYARGKSLKFSIVYTLYLL